MSVVHNYNCRDVLIICWSSLMLSALSTTIGCWQSHRFNRICSAAVHATWSKHQLLWHDKHQASAHNDGSVQSSSATTANWFRKLHNRNRRSLIYCALLQWSQQQRLSSVYGSIVHAQSFRKYILECDMDVTSDKTMIQRIV